MNDNGPAMVRSERSEYSARTYVSEVNYRPRRTLVDIVVQACEIKVCEDELLLPTTVMRKLIRAHFPSD